MTRRPLPTGLRAGRAARGWSQIDAARELTALALARGVPVAAEASLKSLLSRWENGHAVPEPQYRALLGELFARSPRELGLEPAGESGATGPAGLLAAVAAASAVDDATLGLWREQLDVARRLDDELGAAGSAGLVRAQVEQLDHTLSHSLTAPNRAAVAAVLAAAATLAGAQSLDGGAYGEAWQQYDRARTAATTAGEPVAGAVALAGQAAVLIDAGDPASALTLLDADVSAEPAAVRVRWAAARGLAHAAAGDPAACRRAFEIAGQAAHGLPIGVTIDAVQATGAPIELADLHRWHGRALVALGQDSAVTPLLRALDARPRSVRHRAALHADLATALETRSPVDAAAHARTARDLAARIGSQRIVARLDRPGGVR